MMSRLFLILGDQLHPDPHPLLVDFDPARDRLLMIEAAEESTHVWSHKARSALFLAAMRQRMVETNLLSATGRVCAELLRLSRQAEDGVIRPVPVMAELAQRVQSTRETVSRTVSRLEQRGIVQRRGDGLAVVAAHRLEEMVY